jgi:hypothetical protein
MCRKVNQPPITERISDVRGSEIFGIWVMGLIVGALGVVLITLATRAIIRAGADREADRGVPRPPANIFRQ